MSEQNQPDSYIGFRRLPETTLDETHLKGDTQIPKHVIAIIEENAEKTSRGFTSINEPICLPGEITGSHRFPGVIPKVDSEGNLTEIKCNSYESYISGCGIKGGVCRILEVVGPEKMKGPGN